MTIDEIKYFGIFLTLGWILYFICPKKYRYFVLLGYSIAVIYLITGWLLVFILADCFIIYFFGLWIQHISDSTKIKKVSLDKESYQIYKKKAGKYKTTVMWGGLALLLAGLIGLKYSNAIIKLINKIIVKGEEDTPLSLIDLLVPIGLAYYTLQAMSYVIDVKRGKFPAERNVFKVCLFVCYFPQLFEGPIGRYDELRPTLIEGNVEPDSSNYIDGLLQMMFGAVKKIVVADRLAVLTSEIFNNYGNYNGWPIWLGVFAYTVRLYCDFSGVIDMVSGASECFGIRLTKNFDHPFYSLSIGEFWRRWHISLGTWFRDYVFYPLSMSKVSLVINKKLEKNKLGFYWSSFIPMSLSVLIVWALTGLWHGAAFKYLVYGLYYGIIMVFENVFDHYTAKCKWRKSAVYKILALTFVFFLVNVGMMLFNSHH
jgi:alginate O-acetyltransferase complex protein AlgI